MDSSNFDFDNADSDLDYNEWEVQYYNDLEQTIIAYADTSKIKENIIDVKKVVFQKHADRVIKYDKKLVLKQFIKE